MTAVIDTAPTITDPPDELIEHPPKPSAPPGDSTCAHCSNAATLRFNGHQPETVSVPGREPCPCPRPFLLCTRCYVDWFRYYSYKWYTDGFVQCGYCGARGDTIEALMPFDNL